MTVDVASRSGARCVSSRGARDWCSDADTRDNVLARRNVLAALWAGRMMQLPSPSLEGYAAAVHQVDFSEPGDEDVVEKLWGDLNRSGVGITREQVRGKLREFYREAIMQTRETD